MKTARPILIFFLVLLTSCSVLQKKKEISIKPLFWNSQRVSIDKLEEDIPLQKEVHYFQKIDVDTTSFKQSKKKSLSEVQDLEEITVTAKKRITFIPISDGTVKVQFRIDVPREVLNDDWRLELIPNVIVSDTTLLLPKVFIKGSSFFSSQESNYQKYADYLSSIVPEEKYDSAFFDRRKADFALNRILNRNYSSYKNRFEKQKKIKNWFSLQGARYHEERMKSRARLEKKKSFYNILIKDRVQQEYAAGKDTTGIYNKYMARINTKIENFETKGDNMFVSEKYRELLYSDYPKNKLFTRQDSVDLAQDFYKKDKILLNEDKTAEAKNVKERLIPYFYEENFKLDTIVSNNENFTYIYEEYIPIAKKTKNLKLFVDATVHATDLSRFTLEPTDTITYIVSSLAQLADAELKYKKTTIYKNARNKYSPLFVFPTGKADFDILNATNKEEAAKIIHECNVFSDKGGYIVDSIEIYSYIAPNGQWDRSAALSKRRAENVKAYFDPRINTAFSAYPKGEDWNMLAKLIKEDTSIKNKENILQLLSTATNPDATITEIKKKYPREWRYIIASFFPKIERIELFVNLHHPDAENSTESILTKEEEIPNYEKALRLINQQEYWEALEILKEYADYNTALCLVALDYNDKALEVLDRLPQTANSAYLKALVYVRKKENQKAEEQLRISFDLDDSKLSRFRIDDEINTFCLNNNLYKKFMQ